jgi:AbrB family looped-hinge helix DNA binding protein
MRITSKGQVTVPQDIRNKLGLLPNTEVEFELKGNVAVLKKAGVSSRRGRGLLQAMRGKATTRLSTDEIMALTRKA